MTKTVDSPNSTSFISGLKQSRFPLTGLVQGRSHDYLEGRRPRGASTNDVDVHGVSADRSLIRPYVVVIRSRMHLR